MTVVTITAPRMEPIQYPFVSYWHAQLFVLFYNSTMFYTPFKAEVDE